MPWILIIIGSLYGSALGITVQGVMTASQIRFLSEDSCKKAAEKVNEIIKKTGSRGEAFCVRDG